MIVEFKPKNNRPGVRSKKCKPYFNRDCYLKRKAYRKCKNLHWRLQRAETKENLIASSREYKRTLKKQFREYQKSVVDKLKNLRKSDSKAYWSLLNKCDTKGNKAVNKIAMDVLYDHFKNLNALDEQDYNDIVLPNNITDYNIELNRDITEDEVLYAVKSLKNNKACGGDLILNEFLKYGTVKLMPVFVRIFNIVFHSGIIPDSWSEGYICPIFKNKGNPNDVDNYRGITILSCYAESAEELQASLNAMYLYCQTWKIQVNISKTKVVIFSRSRLNTDNMNFKYSGESLNIVTNFQYLGIIFSCKGNFNDAKAHLVQQARKAMFIVLRKARKLNLPIDMQLELFDTMVVPILLYGAEVWGFENCLCPEVGISRSSLLGAVFQRRNLNGSHAGVIVQTSRTSDNSSKKFFCICMYRLKTPILDVTQWERERERDLLKVLESSLEALNCICAYNTVFQLVPV
ncbi:uncharacterized protein [Mytilus edulis]|uniref:uncharacterized protein n=1 Tax=Mytilus edulis TaxID=6550 RepID=UPI0039EE18A2